MGLETILRIIIGTALFSALSYFINSFFYYVFYVIKVVYSGFYLVFYILGASDFSLGVLYYFFVYLVIGVMITLILRFIK